MTDPVFIYIGTYDDEDAARADLDVVRKLYADDVLRTYDAAVVTKDFEGNVSLHRDEESTRHAAWTGAAVGALVGILFPPSLLGDAVIGAAVAGLLGHLWHGMSRHDLKDLGEALDAGEASLVVISTSEFDQAFTAAVKAAAHEIKKLDRTDAKAFERDLKALSDS